MTNENTSDQNDDVIEDFMPPSSGGGEGSGKKYKKVAQPVPKAGSRCARISLIVDCGKQSQEDAWVLPDGKYGKEGDEGAVATPRKDANMVAVFADLPRDNVDYGDKIGRQYYRLMFNGSYGGELKGIVHATSTPTKDAAQKVVKWGMHSNNLLSKLAIACGVPSVCDSGNISWLLNKQLMVNVEVVDSGKTDDDGNKISYVNYKSCAPVAAEVLMKDGEEVLDKDGNAIERIPLFPKLKQRARLITFNNAKPEDIQYIRWAVLKLIKKAVNYPGSNMQVAIDAWEAENGKKTSQASAPAKATPQPAAKKPIAQEKPNLADMDDDNDIPF